MLRDDIIRDHKAPRVVESLYELGLSEDYLKEINELKSIEIELE